MPETKEVLLNFRVDDVVPEPNRTKLFFIIHQSMVDGSLDWGNPIEITNSVNPIDPYSKDQKFMHITKIHNQLSKHLSKVVKRYGMLDFNKYYLVKLNSNTGHPIINHGCVVYLPQTNQLFKYSDDWNNDILLSHEYVFVIPKTIE